MIEEEGKEEKKSMAFLSFFVFFFLHRLNCFGEQMNK